LRLIDNELKQWTVPVDFTYWHPDYGSLGEPWNARKQLKKYSGWKAEPLYMDVPYA